MENQQTHEKKSNGKWVKANAKEAAEESSSDMVSAIQDGVRDLLRSGGETAQSAGRQAVAIAKKYPVQAAIGGLVCGFILGAAMFSGRSHESIYEP